MTTNSPEALFGSRLRDIRRELGMSQAEVAEAMTQVGFTMTQSTIAKAETASRPVRLNEVVMFAKILGVSVHDFVGDSVYKPRIQYLEELRALRKMHGRIRRAMEDVGWPSGNSVNEQ